MTCILLAAGGSSRLGQPKQLVEFRGESLVSRAARKLVDLNVGPVTVITGSDNDKVLKVLENHPIQVIFNEDWELGMGSSLALGASKLSDQFTGVLILLCDQWRVDKEDLRRLIENWHCDISGISVASWGNSKKKHFGPPVIFPKELFSALTALKGDQGARKLIRENLNKVTFVDLVGAAFDLDELADLEQMLGF